MVDPTDPMERGLAEREIAFTETAVRGAQYVAGTGPYTEYRFANIGGLVLIVMRPVEQGGPSTKTWRCHYSHTPSGGKRIKRKVTLGRFMEAGEKKVMMGLAEAQKRAAEIMATVKVDKVDVVGERKRKEVQDKQDALTFADLVADYVADRRARGSTTIDELERALKLDAIPALGHMRPKDITPTDVQRAVDAVCERMAKELVERKKRLGEAVTKEDESRRDFEMARHVRRYIAQVFNYALLDDVEARERYGVTTNPAAAVGRSRRGMPGRYGRSKARTRFLDDAGIKEFMTAVEASAMSASMKAMLKVALLTCTRSDEVRCARIEELKLDGAEPVWVLPPGLRTKNRQGRVIPLVPAVAQIFKSAVGTRKSGPVFEGQGADGLVNPKGMRQAIARLVSAGTMQTSHISPHDLRRTVETGLTALGVSKEIRDQVLGHTPQDVGSKHYNQYSFIAEKRHALTLWADHVASLAR